MGNDTWATRAARLGCATLVDAMGRVHGHRAHVPAMASPDPLRPLFVPAATISYLPYREDLVAADRDFRHYFYGALGTGSPADQVLVLSIGGYPDVSHGGGTKLARADGAGPAGILADGRLRDFGQLRDYDFAMWCKGEAVRWGGDTVMPHAFGEAVEISGAWQLAPRPGPAGRFAFTQ
ncbi:RraA family protein [Streptomyces sp. 900105755]